MALMSLPEADKKLLHNLAFTSIRHGLDTGHPLKLNLTDFPKELKVHRASFVTLERQGQLRGCIGMLEAERPLVEDIVQNAYAAAFRDPRFLPLSKNEIHDLDLHISILSPAEAMQFNSESDLLAQLRPGIDGLILQEGHRRGTFLPSVWEQLPDPAQFLQQLRQKAGLPADYWSNTIKIARYSTELIP